MKTEQQQIYDRIKSSLTLDMLRIDEHLMELPVQIQEAGEQSSRAIFHRDSMEHRLKVVTAMAADLMRREERGISEAKINSLVPLDEDVAKAREEVEDAKLDAQLWAALVSSLMIKSSMLKRLIDMQVSGLLTPNAIREKERPSIRRRPLSEIRTGREFET